jgi:hypothetical protein
MRRRSRTRRILKWVGMVGCLVIAVAFFGSGWWAVMLALPLQSNGHPEVGFLSGCFCVLYDERNSHGSPSFSWSTYTSPFRNQPRYYIDFSISGLSSSPLHGVAVPLWLLWVAFAIPTAFLWYRDRRPPRGHCRSCGYNLTGNESGTCPECGEAIA